MFHSMRLIDEEREAPSAKNDGAGVLDTRQAATYLGVREQTLVLWRTRGEGPRCVRKGHKYVRYRKVDLEDWLAANLSE